MSSAEYLLDSSREYAIYVAENRAIPKVMDGLKHGQRVALWVLRNRAEKLKTFALSGLLGYEKLYVHGETSANDAIGKLAAPYKNNVPLIEGLGQFGNRVAPVDGIGAPRYTEVRRSKAAEAFLYNDSDLVPLAENYDGSNKSALHFLPLIPTVLLNGVNGVAVGWSTEILPRSFKSLVQATQDALMGKPIKGLEPHFERYDVRVENVGPNQWRFYGRAEIVDTSTVRILELPPGLLLESFRGRLIELENEDKINTFVDRSTDRIDITVKFKRGEIKGWTEKDAIKFFKLHEQVTERIVVVSAFSKLMAAEEAINKAKTPTQRQAAQELFENAHKSINTYDSPETVVREFVQWRLGWYTKRFEKLKADANYELLYWLALESLFRRGFLKTLGKHADRKAVETAVVETIKADKLSVDDRHLDRIVNLPTYRWTKAFEAEVVAKIAELRGQIGEYETILASPVKLRDVYHGELETLKKGKF